MTDAEPEILTSNETSTPAVDEMSGEVVEGAEAADAPAEPAPSGVFKFNVPAAAAPLPPLEPPRTLPWAEIGQGALGFMLVLVLDLLLPPLLRRVTDNLLIAFSVGSVLKIVALLIALALRKRTLAIGIAAGVAVVFLGYLVMLLRTAQAS
jgi:hypothetical protein